MEYRYHLLKYRGKAYRLNCPNCGRKNCFAPYVDSNDQIVGEQYGRCDHESSCGYVKYPQTERDWRKSYVEYRQRMQQQKPRPVTRPKPQPEPPGGICIIPSDIVDKTVRPSTPSDFLVFLQNLLGKEKSDALVNEYRIGVTKSRYVIFYQIDIKGRCRTGKVMKYNPETGCRIKDPSAKTPITWVHSLLKQQGKLPADWELAQCLFGEHLLAKYHDKMVCLVEAEKTAVICAGIVLDAIWLATGGKGQLNDRVEVLYGRQVLAFPDVDGYEAWVEKARDRPYLNIVVSDLLERTATQEQRDAHIDIADILIDWRSPLSGILSPPPIVREPADLYRNNPVMQEVMKYISTEYWENMDALIRELDLELVSIKRTVQ